MISVVKADPNINFFARPLEVGWNILLTVEWRIDYGHRSAKYCEESHCRLTCTVIPAFPVRDCGQGSAGRRGFDSLYSCCSHPLTKRFECSSHHLLGDFTQPPCTSSYLKRRRERRCQIWISNYSSSSTVGLRSRGLQTTYRHPVVLTTQGRTNRLSIVKIMFHLLLLSASVLITQGCILSYPFHYAYGLISIDERLVVCFATFHPICQKERKISLLWVICNVL